MPIQDVDVPAPLDSSAPVEPVLATTDAPGFDLESYIARYSGYTKLARLQLVAKHCPRLEAQAYSLLAAEIQLGVNTDCYRAHSARLAPLFEPSWCDEVDAAARANIERLEGVIAGARSSMAKEQVKHPNNTLSMSKKEIAFKFMDCSVPFSSFRKFL